VQEQVVGAGRRRSRPRRLWRWATRRGKAAIKKDVSWVML